MATRSKTVTIKLNIYSANDKENIIFSLANNGYKVWVEEIQDEPHDTPEYFVCFECNIIEIIEED